MDIRAKCTNPKCTAFDHVKSVMLDEYQPSVSNLLKGSISQVSIEKLLRYADRLHLQTSISVRPMETKQRREKSHAGANARQPSKKVAVAV